MWETKIREPEGAAEFPGHVAGLNLNEGEEMEKQARGLLCHGVEGQFGPGGVSKLKTAVR